MSHLSQRETGKAGRNRRTEGVQRPLRLNAQGRRLLIQAGRSQARRVVREDELGGMASAYPTDAEALLALSPYERAMSYGMRLGIISAVVALLMLHQDQFRGLLNLVSGTFY